MNEEKKMPFVEIYSDGACSGNPGVGGFGAILRTGDKEKELSDAEGMTTNNRMELMGVITALEALKVSCKVKITTDSTYVVKGMTEWINAWINRGWKNSQKKDVLNRDLWERLLKAAEPHDITWHWVRGHNGHAENERCDILALEAIKRHKKSSAFNKECISRSPSPQPSPSGGEGYNYSPPLRGGSPQATRRGEDEGEGDLCGFTNDLGSKRTDV